MNDFIYVLDYPRVKWNEASEVPKVPDWFRPLRNYDRKVYAKIRKQTTKAGHPWRASCFKKRRSA